MLHQLDFLGAHDRIKEYLKRFCDRFEDVKVDVGQGLARTFLREAGLSDMLSGIRMSDGTLKFLCLLAVLFHPKPAPLVCIEEPELGLHPDALRLVAEVLVEASERTQLIITTIPMPSSTRSPTVPNLYWSANATSTTALNSKGWHKTSWTSGFGTTKRVSERRR